jgi:uncharacterized membrane protein
MSPHVIAALVVFGIGGVGIAFMVIDSVRAPRRKRRADVDYVWSVGRQNGWRP